MAIYKDKKTGAVIHTDSELGGDWELVEAPKKPKKTKKEVVENND